MFLVVIFDKNDYQNDCLLECKYRFLRTFKKRLIREEFFVKKITKKNFDQ